MTERDSKAGSPVADFTVGDWLVRPSLNLLERGGEASRVRPQLMDLLVCLASRAGRVVTREEIHSSVWPGQFVAETGLTRSIAELRSALGDTAGRESKYIATISKRGYRLVAPVGVPAVVGSTPLPEVPVGSSPGSGQPVADTGDSRAPIAATGAPGKGAAPANSPLRLKSPVMAAAGTAVAALGFAVWRIISGPSDPPRDTLVLAFENMTGDPVFDGTLRLALSVQLQQSPALRVVSEQRVREELGFMNRPADTRVTRATGLEICQRVGARVLVSGSLAPLGKHYALGLEGIACESGRVIAQEQVEAPTREEVLAVLGRAVSSIRARLGESVASIRRHDVPIAQATTASLEALKAFSQGDFERAGGNDEDAVRFYRRATELDPSFALAHMRLGLQLVNLARYGEGVDELRRAYETRDRASEAERFYITSFYYERVLRDPIKAVEPLEMWRDAYPTSAVPRFTLASMYGRIGLFDRALPQAEEAMRLEPLNALAASVMIETLQRLGRLDEARRLAEEHVSRGRGGVIIRAELAEIAFASDDEAGWRREIDWAAGVPGAAPAFLDLQSRMARFGGRMQDASRLANQRMMLAEQHGDPVVAAIAGLEQANDRALAGQSREALPLVLAALQKARTPETVVRAALALAWAGQADVAEQYLREHDGMADVTPASDPDFKPAALALITMARGSPQSALETLAPLRPYEMGWRFNFLPPYIRGIALLRLNRAAEAAAEFDRIARQRGAEPTSLVYALSWLQMGRAKAASGDTRGARAAYERFLRYWQRADPDLPVLAQAREELARLR